MNVILDFNISQMFVVKFDYGKLIKFYPMIQTNKFNPSFKISMYSWLSMASSTRT